MRYSIVEGAVNPESCLFPLPPLSAPSSFLFPSLLPISLSTSDAPPPSLSLALLPLGGRNRRAYYPINNLPVHGKFTTITYKTL
jgi:hypothetical protein